VSEEARKPHRDNGIHINQVNILGRIYAPPQDKGKFVKVSVVVPAWKQGGGRQWVPMNIDVVGDEPMATAKQSKASDLFLCTCFLVDREVETVGGEKRTLKILQLDPYREVGLMAMPAVPNPEDPPMDGLCYSRVLLAGRHFINKNQLKEGQETPVLRDGTNSKYCYVKMTYQDPFQQLVEDQWPKDIFFEFSLNGPVAEIAAAHCRHRAQLVVRGELNKKEADFEVMNKQTGAPTKPREIKISLVPGGFSFMNTGGGGAGAQKTPSSPQTLVDDDIPF
jgi:hypothetical protein